MADPEILERLARHRIVGAAPESEREWLAMHGVLEWLGRGEVHIRKGESATALHIVLRGHLVIRSDRGAGAQKVFEWVAGDVAGVLPYSRGASPPSDIIAEEPTEVLAIDRAHFPELTRVCPQVTASLVHSMLDRARQFTWADLRDERLLSLGRLAAGLAHELNNPATSALRGARLLIETHAASEAAARLLGTVGLDPGQIEAITAIRARCRDPLEPGSLSALERADREEAMSSWLEAHRSSGRYAPAFVAANLAPDTLTPLTERLHGEALEAALQWIAAGCEIRALAATIETSALRIHELVQAVKGFTYMDQAPAAQPVDVCRGIRDTLTVLRSKIRRKSAVVQANCPAGLPAAHGVGGELNQVWMNLLDNALDAIDEGGHVEVSVGEDLGRLIVRVVDDGPGIPPEAREHIFEPFFTTKAVGEGTGLGLDIVRRILHRHDGLVDLESRPGRTEFRISLPISARVN